MTVTAWGINPSFQTYYARQITFADPLRRAKFFEYFTDQGEPTNQPCPVGPDGWPVDDGRSHGVRLFADMKGTSPLLDVSGCEIKQNANGASIWWRAGRPTIEALGPDRPKIFYPPGIAMAAQFIDRGALRTLDWQRTNERPDWTQPRVKPSDPIQGSRRGMAIELQVSAANAVRAPLWWCAPVRFSASPADYAAKMTEMLTVIRDQAERTPVLEYGNELWNAMFPAHSWLQTITPNSRWQDAAAIEIAHFWRIADQVFGSKPYIKFVGADRENPPTLERILSQLPEMPEYAGPAAYVGPLKADKIAWEASGAVPTQDQLRASCFSRLPQVEGKLAEHKTICQRHGVGMAVYEAGQSFIASGKPWRRAAIIAQRELWMGDLYRELRASINHAGVDYANYYSLATDQEPSDQRTDVFGLLEGHGFTMLPKALAARGG